MRALHIRLLGGFSARLSSGETAVIPIRKGQALLAYFALNPDDAVARARLAALLWGDYDERRARSNLRETLNVLRKALGPAQHRVLRADRTTVALDGAAVDVDALTFRRLVETGSPAALEAAVALHRGDLLDGLDISDSGFQEWLDAERRRFHDMMVDALDALILHKREEGAAQEALVHAQRLLVLEPLREDVHRTLIALNAELGRRHAAHLQYERCRDLLASELDVEPEPETVALYRALLNGGGASADPGGRKPAGAVHPKESGAGAEVRRGPRFRPPSVAMARVLRERGRRTPVASRALFVGMVVALLYLLAWGNPGEYAPPDPRDRLDLAALSADGLAGVAGGGFADASTPATPDRLAPRPPTAKTRIAAAAHDLPEGLSMWSRLARVDRGRRPEGAEPPVLLASLDHGPGMLEGFPAVSAPPAGLRRAPAHPAGVTLDLAAVGGAPDVLLRDLARDARGAASREAARLWPALAESWDLGALRAFRARYDGTEEAAEADGRIAFLIARHRDAQAALNRLGHDAGPVDGIWGARSARAMRAFQSGLGETPDGQLSDAWFARLEAAKPAVAMRTAAVPDAPPQPGEPAPEIAVAVNPPFTNEGGADARSWTASGMAGDGTRIVATATRQGDTLKLVFEVDHGDAVRVGSQWAHRYRHRCTTPASGKTTTCWLPNTAISMLGGKVTGTFPMLRFEFLPRQFATMPLPQDIVLEFEPDLDVAAN